MQMSRVLQNSHQYEPFPEGGGKADMGGILFNAQVDGMR